MPSLRDVRRRIRSVQNTRQITKAMEIVAATRMRRAQNRMEASRPYAQKLDEVLATVAQRVREVKHPYLIERQPIKNVCMILVTTDRGLCGSLNSNIIRKAVEVIRDYTSSPEFVTIGRKGRDFIRRYYGGVVAEVTGISEKPDYDAMLPCVEVAESDFLSGKVDAVFVAYARYVSTVRQEPVVERLIPVPQAELQADSVRASEYIYEPDAESLLSKLLPRYVEAKVYHALLETSACEQAARMVAMRNASDNAEELIRDLILYANKIRQDSITKELMEISAGAEALRKSREMMT